MDARKFRESLQNSQPPADTNVHLQALWYDAKGDWERAHELIQDLPDAASARIHGYLHRREGDQSNALYWYRRAGLPGFQGPLEEEWDAIVQTL